MTTPISPPELRKDAQVLVLMLDLDIEHLKEKEVLRTDPRGNIRWNRSNRQSETTYIRTGGINFSCFVLSEDSDAVVLRLREILDPQNDPGYSAVIVVFARHPDVSADIAQALARELGDSSAMPLICFDCCGRRPAIPAVGWDAPLVCSLPRPGDPKFHDQFADDDMAALEDDLAYYVSHSMEPPGQVPGVAVGALLFASGNGGRFFLAKRKSGSARGTHGTIGGPLHRGSTFIDSLRKHASQRLGLSDRVVATFREGPVLACTNLIGNLDHDVDITFLVTVDEEFEVADSRYVDAYAWYSFEEMTQIYEGTLVNPGRGLYSPGGGQTMFAPVRNAFEGYCLLLLSGAVGETLLPGFVPRNVDASAAAAIAAERARRKSWLSFAARVHEQVTDSSPFLYEQTHDDA